MEKNITIRRDRQTNRIELVELDDDEFVVWSRDITDEAVKEVLDHLFEAQGVECGSLTFERKYERIPTK